MMFVCTYLRGRNEAQMSVEVAIVLPVMLVMAFVIANLMSFIEACNIFDRVAPDIVAAQATSPAGDGSDTATGAIRADIESALNRPMRCEVEVTTEGVNRSLRRSGVFSLGPQLTRYVCTLRYRPWPHSFVIAGVAFSVPAFLSHTKTIVIDRYRSGVVM